MRALRSGWVSVVLNALTATLTAIYAGYYVALPDSNAQESLEAWHRINALGWKNTYGGVALFCLAAQAVQTHFAETRRQELARSRDERQASRLLQGIVGLLETAHPGINFRAFVTI
ncbi:MAG: hypothetical protein JO079_00840, partial [Frankiaceae bacterium]|nr:hypothetical protein [Frankiaceae bacterium]